MNEYFSQYADYYDLKYFTPNDYTILINGLPKESQLFTTDMVKEFLQNEIIEELKSIYQNKDNKDYTNELENEIKKVKVVKVMHCYDLYEYNQRKNTLNELYIK